MTHGTDAREEATEATESATAGVLRALAVRRETVRLCEHLSPEDLVVQSMPDASPAKWHLAHTTWFFERFVLRALGLGLTRETYAQYDYLFNSYYETVGDRHPRPKRGLLTRPALAEVLGYREEVDARLADAANSPRLAELATTIALATEHEQQHQELLLTDLKHLFGTHPLRPAYRANPAPASANGAGERPPPVAWAPFDARIASIGSEGDSFCFDNELPRHKVYVEAFEIATRPVTVGEFRAFVKDGGYTRPELWLSDGWAWVRANERRAPLYWFGDDELYTLDGPKRLVEDEPVCHVTYFEADAYARWAGARLPRETEWEIAAERRERSSDGTFLGDGALHPGPARRGERSASVLQMLGDVWEWTQSAYAPYPGFRPFADAFSEYNGKFMVNQMVLRGGSCVTPKSQARVTYRNFFPPDAAWQFSGFRMARDA